MAKKDTPAGTQAARDYWRANGARMPDIDYVPYPGPSQKGLVNWSHDRKKVALARLHAAADHGEKKPTSAELRAAFWKVMPNAAGTRWEHVIRTWYGESLLVIGDTEGARRELLEAVRVSDFANPAIDALDDLIAHLGVSDPLAELGIE